MADETGKPEAAKAQEKVDIKELTNRIQNLLDEEINPGISMHGGWCSLLEVSEDMKVYVQLAGGCQGCGMVDVTLKHGIETVIKERFPAIVGVVDTTDHATGTNPYYTPGKF